MPIGYDSLVLGYSHARALEFLTELNLQLTGVLPLEHDNPNDLLQKLTALVPLVSGRSEAAKTSAASTAADSPRSSLQATRVLSRNIVSVLALVPTKVYDTANDLFVQLEAQLGGRPHDSSNALCIILLDIFEAFPLHITALVGYALSHIYKTLKKYPEDLHMVNLLPPLFLAALKADVEDKAQAKWAKFVAKVLSSNTAFIEGDLAASPDAEPAFNAALAQHYITALGHILQFQVLAHYQQLLEVSAASASASKAKPEVTMAQQHQFQQSVLSLHQKIIVSCLKSTHTVVRSAMVDLLAHLLINFVATGKFNAVSYLIGLYPMPALNLWNQTLSTEVGPDNEPLESKKEKSLPLLESNAAIRSNMDLLLLQTGCVQAVIAYIQLELLQDSEYISTSLVPILNTILSKFHGLDHPLHVMNQLWASTVKHWTSVVDFLICETGSSSHDTLSNFVVLHLSLTSDLRNPTESQMIKKRASSLFGFVSKKSKGSSASQNPVTPFTNPYQLRLLLEIVIKLLPFGIDFNSALHTSDDQKQDQQEDSDDFFEDGQGHTTKNSFLVDTMLSLVINANEIIRNYTLVALVKYTLVYPSESNYLVLRIFAVVSQQFNDYDPSKEQPVITNDRNTTQSDTVKLYAYSLALLSIIKHSDSTLLQNSTVARILSFCTQNLKHTSTVGQKHLRIGSCWLILSSLVKLYPDSEFVKLNSSQFLVFWKNLLTSQFVGSLGGELSLNESADIIRNLKIRTLSLICLVNYVEAVDLTPDVSRQLQFLFVKAHKYLLHLESTFESVGEVISFSPHGFNGASPTINYISNNIFSGRTESLPVQDQLVSLILLNKKVLNEGFIHLAHTLKGDVSSSLVVFLSRVIADPKIFTRSQSSEGSAAKSKLQDIALDPRALKYCFFKEKYDFSFGVTSKFMSNRANIDELFSQTEAALAQVETYCYSDPFEAPHVSYTASSVEQEIEAEHYSWIDYFEDIIRSQVHDVNFDVSTLVLHRYSSREPFSPRLMTSLIDSSIELFQLVFPSLSYKIQFSLLEQMRSAVTFKGADEMRKNAVIINVAVTLHGLLSNLAKKKIPLDPDHVIIILEIYQLIETTSPQLIKICADSIGLAITFLQNAQAEDFISTCVTNIAADASPYKRGKLAMCLARINHYSHLSFQDIYSVLTQLTRDPHHVVSYYSLDAVSILLETLISNPALTQELIEKIFTDLINGVHDMNFDNKSLAHLRMQYFSISRIAKVLKSSVTSLGPGLREFDEHFKLKLFHILFLLASESGIVSLEEYTATLSFVMLTCQELIVYDPHFVKGFEDWFTALCLFIISANMKCGYGLSGPLTVNKNDIFPMTSSHELTRAAFLSLIEMTKMGHSALTKDSLSLAWVLMQLKPCPEVKQLVSYWVESSTETHWFSQLTVLYHLPARKLVGLFLDVNYQQKLLPLLQREKKSQTGGVIDFADEESQNIVESENENSDKSQPISWEFKLLLYDVLARILTSARNNPAMITELNPKIQEIVRLSFLGTTASILQIKLKGVGLLDQALELFGQLEDPIYTGVSILEQQQAQIISALVPCFNSDSNADVIVKATNVSSVFINLPRIKFYSKQRILKTMINLLEEISSGKYLTFEFLGSMAEYGRKSVQLAILNCWAVLKIVVLENEEAAEPELVDILNKYSDLLMSLWILVLRELSSLKYNQSSSRELALFSSYWLNFVDVLSLVADKSPAVLETFLKEDERNFFFVMFCQCTEALIKNQDVYRSLQCLNRLLKIEEVVDTILQDEVFSGIIDLLDRLMVMETNTVVKCTVLDGIEILFDSLALRSSETSLKEKSLELLRVAMLPMFETYPFLRQDFNPEDAAQKIVLRKCDSEDNIQLLKKQTSVLVHMMTKLPGETQEDICACVLFLFAKFYDFGNESLVSVVLPHLKVTLQLLSNQDLADSFWRVLEGCESLTFEKSGTNYLVTIMVLITAGRVDLLDAKAQDFAHALISGLQERATAGASLQCIKTLMSSASNRTVKIILREITSWLFESLNNAVNDESLSKVKLEVLMLLVQSSSVDTDEKAAALYGVLIPLMVSQYTRKASEKLFLREKMLTLVRARPDCFKAVVSDGLDDAQRSQAEALMKSDEAETSAVSESTIELKTFT